MDEERGQKLSTRTRDAALARADITRLGMGRAFAERFLKLLGMRFAAKLLPERFHGRARRIVLRSAARVEVLFNASVAPPLGPRAVLISHDLSRSGAPKIVLEIATILWAAGYEVTVLSASDGPISGELIELGATVVIDPAALTPNSPTVAALGRKSDIAICNTVLSAAAVRTLSRHVPTFWYIHEISLLAEILSRGPRLGRTFAKAKSVWAGSELSAALIRPYFTSVEVMPYGLEPIPWRAPPQHAASARIGLFASIESRKGQDLALAAIALLLPEQRALISLVIHGRVLDAPFRDRLCETLRLVPEATIGDELDRVSYQAALLDCDAILIPSRDDTLPLVSLDALSAGRVLMCTATTGTSAHLHPGVDGFVAAAPSASAIAEMLSEALQRRADWQMIGLEGQALFARTFSKDAFAARLHQALETAIPIPVTGPA